jgi:putative ABC transport system substrate-binding protein
MGMARQLLPYEPTQALPRQNISAAAQNHVPAVYYLSQFVKEGGLLSYGVDGVDTSRRAASYVDRILRGEKPGDLPVQFPTKFEMAVNRKTATALGLAVPPYMAKFKNCWHGN